MQTEDNKPVAEDNIPSTDNAAKTEATTAAPGGGTSAAPAPVIEVPVDKMDKILDELQALREKDVQRDQEIEILRESVSRGRLDEAEGRRKKEEPPRAKVMVHNKKLVTGWKMTKNELVYNPLNQMVPATEKLEIALSYHDGSESGPIPYVNFVRTLDRATVTKVREDGIMWVVQLDDPELYAEELAIDPQYLNP